MHLLNVNVSYSSHENQELSWGQFHGQGPWSDQTESTSGSETSGHEDELSWGQFQGQGPWRDRTESGSTSSVMPTLCHSETSGHEDQELSWGQFHGQGPWRDLTESTSGVIFHVDDLVDFHLTANEADQPSTAPIIGRDNIANYTAAFHQEYALTFSTTPWMDPHVGDINFETSTN